ALAIQKHWPTAGECSAFGICHDGKTVMRCFEPQQRVDFEMEVTRLKAAQSLAFVPRLLYVDHDRYTYYTNECGKRPAGSWDHVRRLRGQEKVWMLRSKFESPFTHA